MSVHCLSSGEKRRLEEVETAPAEGKPAKKPGNKDRNKKKKRKQTPK